jgi:Ala-tRNA(Pro) deacylase
MPVERLKEYLDTENVRYVSLKHSQAYTAQEVAATAHVSGKELAKTVMVKIDGEMTMVVLPASSQVDLRRLQEAVGSRDVELAAEQEFADDFPDCELGAMPPFGNLYGMKVFVSPALRQEEEIAFNAGSHSELIRLTYKDFDRLVHPTPIAL